MLPSILSVASHVEKLAVLVFVCGLLYYALPITTAEPAPQPPVVDMSAAVQVPNL